VPPSDDDERATPKLNHRRLIAGFPSTTSSDRCAYLQPRSRVKFSTATYKVDTRHGSASRHSCLRLPLVA
jgi:hypothetical protein